MYTNKKKKTKRKGENKEKIIRWHFAVTVGQKFSIICFTTMRTNFYNFQFFLYEIVLLTILSELPSISFSARTALNRRQLE